MGQVKVSRYLNEGDMWALGTSGWILKISRKEMLIDGKLSAKTREDSRVALKFPAW